MQYPCKSRRITSGFGYRHRTNNEGKVYTDFHPGTDYGAIIAGVSGESLRPVANNGKVVEVGYDKYRGNYITIEHTEHCFKYCHCKEIYASIGDIVDEDDIVALMGNTGDSSGPHLHLEVHKCKFSQMYEKFTNGEPKHVIDPEMFFMQYIELPKNSEAELIKEVRKLTEKLDNIYK